MKKAFILFAAAALVICLAIPSMASSVNTASAERVSQMSTVPTDENGFTEGSSTTEGGSPSGESDSQPQRGLTDGGETSDEQSRAKEASLSEDFNIEEYLTEKIAPVLAGVATSLVALLGGLTRVRTAVKGLDRTGKEISHIKETVTSAISDMEVRLKNGLKEIEESLSAVPEIKDGYDEIRKGCDELRAQSEKLLEAIRLGFESFPQTVKCGNARKIAVLTDTDSSKETEK